jgi:hypothetical protein
MAKTKQNPIVHLLPSLTDVAFLMPLIFMFAKLNGAQALLRDGDTGWHIRTGEWILSNHRVPHQDIFSFTKPGAPWFAWEWLSDVIFGWLHLHWGLAGVVVLGMLMLCLTSALLFRLVQRRCGNPLISIVLTFVAVCATSIHWHARPHLFTILFAVVFLYLLERVQSGEIRWLFLLPVIIAVWTNLHGGFFVGLLFLVCYAVGDLFAWLIAADRTAAKPALTSALRYAAAFAACLAATLLNPYTYRLHLFIWHFLGQPFIDGISEYLTPNFHNTQTRFIEVLLIVGLASAIWSAIHRRFADVLMIIGWAHLSLFSSRNVPIFAIAAAPVAAAALNDVISMVKDANIANWCRSALGGFSGIGTEIAEIDSAWRLHAISALAMCAVGFIVIDNRLDAKYAAHFDAEHFPVGAAEVLATRPSTTRVFTIDQYADYLIYRMYPNWRVFYDGRADMYGYKHFEKVVKIVNAGGNWQKDLDSFGVESVLLPVEAPLAGALKVSPEWRPVYDNHHAILFDRVHPQHDFQTVRLGKLPCSPAAAAENSGRDRNVAANNNPDRAITRHNSL